MTKQLQYKEPTAEQWEKAVDGAANQAIRELANACFVCDALSDLFMPDINHNDVAEWGEDWDVQYDDMYESLRTSGSIVKFDFEIDLALAVAKKLREQKRTGKTTPVPRRRRRRIRTY